MTGSLSACRCVGQGKQAADCCFPCGCCTFIELKTNPMAVTVFFVVRNELKAKDSLMLSTSVGNRETGRQQVSCHIVLGCCLHVRLQV